MVHCTMCAQSFSHMKTAWLVLVMRVYLVNGTKDKALKEC